jgi:regulation of enolase protein 1 (concanavalin A-like superfamily)
VHFPRVWLKLIRKGDLFTGLFSEDGVHWKPYCEHRQALEANSYLGLAATSHNEAQAIKSKFSHLRIS